MLKLVKVTAQKCFPHLISLYRTKIVLHYFTCCHTVSIPILLIFSSHLFCIYEDKNKPKTTIPVSNKLLPRIGQHGRQQWIKRWDCLAFHFEGNFSITLFLWTFVLRWASLVAQTVKNLLVMKETQVWFLGQQDLLKEGMATPSIFLSGEFHGQSSMVGYSPVGHIESF